MKKLCSSMFFAVRFLRLLFIVTSCLLPTAVASTLSPPLEFNKGVMYENGKGGVTQDYVEAARWYRLAAEQGYAQAQCNLGLLYESGKGVTQDYAEAARWYHLAAEQGHAQAQFNLGLLYKSGRGVTQDSAEAERWFRLAAEQGYASNQYTSNLKADYTQGQGIIQSRGLKRASLPAKERIALPPPPPPVPAPVMAAPAPQMATSSAKPENGHVGYGSAVSESANGQKAIERKAAFSSLSTPGSSVETSRAQSMPTFDWPPPKASAQVVIPDSYLRRSGKGVVLFRDVDAIFRSALDNCGYSEYSYYAVPDGFAVVTRIEQINKNGVPKAGDSRWSLKSPPVNPFSDFSAYMNALFNGSPGYYRVIVFIITSSGFNQSPAGPSREHVEGWFSGGFNVLDEEVAKNPYTNRHRCTALIYEFKKTPQRAIPLVPGDLPGKTHLLRAGIWSFLQSQHHE
ncbi:MAG: tetratricopeptide repeat protein [Chlorobiaceae bacterium]